MRIQDIMYDFVCSLITMFGFALVCAPITEIVWNACACQMAPTILQPVGFPESILLNFGYNLFIFFKLTKKDIIIANQAYQEELEEEDV